MFLEWWMIAILIALSVGWGEYRYRDGKIDGKVSAKLQGGINVVAHLVTRGLLEFKNDGSFVGKDGRTWNPITNNVTFDQQE